MTMEEKVNWWDKPENIIKFDFPLSIVKSGNQYVVFGNEETKKLIGEHLSQCAQGDTPEEAINDFFFMLRMMEEMWRQQSNSYERFVPFKKGNWRKIGGTWFTIFGLHLYFRYGKNMKQGFYIPLTKLNISFSNLWKLYKKNYKK